MSFDSQEPDGQQLDDDIKSKSQVKAELKEITQFGTELSELSINNLKKLPLTEEIIDAYASLDRIKGNEARKRHFKRIGKLLRDIDIEPIELAFARFKRGLPLIEPDTTPTLGETWYERLVTDKENPENFLSQYPNCDRQQLRQLVRNAQKLPARNKRKLIDYLNTFA